MSNKSSTARRPLIEPGSILSAPSLTSSMLDNVIGRDREKSGRAAPAGDPGGPDDSGSPEGGLVAEAAPNTETLTDLSRQVSKEISNLLSKQVSKSVGTSSNTQSRNGRPSRAGQHREQGDGEPPAVPSARQRLLSHTEREAVTRLSIDVPMSMYGRIKQYVAVHNVESIRALTLALYEDFLEEEGF